MKIQIQSQWISAGLTLLLLSIPTWASIDCDIFLLGGHLLRGSDTYGMAQEFNRDPQRFGLNAAGQFFEDSSESTVANLLLKAGSPDPGDRQGASRSVINVIQVSFRQLREVLLGKEDGPEGSWERVQNQMDYLLEQHPKVQEELTALGVRPFFYSSSFGSFENSGGKFSGFIYLILHFPKKIHSPFYSVRVEISESPSTQASSSEKRSEAARLGLTLIYNSFHYFELDSEKSTSDFNLIETAVFDSLHQVPAGIGSSLINLVSLKISPLLDPFTAPPKKDAKWSSQSSKNGLPTSLKPLQPLQPLQQNDAPNVALITIENGIPGEAASDLPIATRSDDFLKNEFLVLGKFVPYSKTIRNANVGGPPVASRFVSRSSLEQQIAWGWSWFEKISSFLPKNSGKMIYSSTVTTNREGGMAWIGLSYQPHGMTETHSIFVHFRLTQASSREQKETMKQVGRSLIQSGKEFTDRFRLAVEPGVGNDSMDYLLNQFISSLITNSQSFSSPRQRDTNIEIDFLGLQGSLYKDINSRKIAFHLINALATNHLLLSPSGEILPAYEALYGRTIVAYRQTERNFQAKLQNVLQDIGQRSGIKPDQIQLIESIDIASEITRIYVEHNYMPESRPDALLLITSGNSPLGLAEFLKNLNTGTTGVIGDEITTEASDSGKTVPQLIHDPAGRRKYPLIIY